MVVDKYAALCKCIYIFIIGNQLTIQNNDKYCPENLTGTTFSIKNMTLTNTPSATKQLG